MSYRKYSIPVLDPLEWYERTASGYRQYRDHLTSFDHNIYTRFLPRDISHCDILDVGAGDGRVYEYFKNRHFRSYTVMDISPAMLEQLRASNVHKVVADMNETRPLTDSAYDISLCFFVLEYVTDLQDFFAECYRVLRQEGMLIFSYFYQRREFVFGHADEQYKIEQSVHTYDHIREALEYNFFTIEELPLRDKGRVVGYIYSCSKR